MTQVATPLEAAELALRKSRESVSWDLAFEIMRALKPGASEREQERLCQAIAEFLS